mmetsp:Transcript_26735/g.63398  ORF Transcript_26735/g.63398 Transcript_26735/m.63398 type:complete len:205 (+) Transcript_26735:543-1157(+)
MTLTMIPFASQNSDRLEAFCAWSFFMSSSRAFRRSFCGLGGSPFFSCFWSLDPPATSSPAKVGRLEACTCRLGAGLRLLKSTSRVRGPAPSSRSSSVDAGSSGSVFACFCARSICSCSAFAARVSSSRSCLSRLLRRSSSSSCAGSLDTRVMNQPFSVSSTLHLPSRPRYLTNSVRVVHFVEFMWMWCLFAMNSFQTTVAWTRL